MLEIEKDDMGILKQEKVEKPKEPLKVSPINELPLVEITQLPSMFKCYDKDVRICYEPMKIKELEILNSGTASVLDGLQFILNAIKCTNMNTEDLLYWDFIYIGIIRKILAFGDVRGQLNKICPNCQDTVSHVFNYTDLEFEELKHGPATLKFKDGTILKLKPLTVKQFLELPSDSNIVDVYARMIYNMPLEDAQKFVNNLHGNQIKAMAKAEQELAYGLKPFKVKCPHCHQETELEVTLPFEVVFPEDSDTDIDDVEIRFGD